jgi:4-hydroxythreonine-4-phosphate dehydrogenase
MSRILISRLAVSIGCPCGVGPEVAVSAAAELTGARALLVGDLGVLRAAARVRKVDPARLVAVSAPEAAWGLDAPSIAVWQPSGALAAKERAPGRPARAAGAAQLAWIDAACDLVARGEADALVTGPVSKDVIAHSGAPGAREFKGHTEHLQHRVGAREVVMAFWAERLVTALVTTHLPISAVPRAITPAAVARATFWLADLLVATGARTPAIAVSGLNPHAGEGGLLGRDETRAIVPGMARAEERIARAKLRARVIGPVPAESAFRLAVAGTYAGVVAMYHDQATIAMKLASFGEAVNVSLGLPIVRTSVDHGTAYDRAGAGTASDAGMRGAMKLAARLAGARFARGRNAGRFARA